MKDLLRRKVPKTRYVILVTGKVKAYLQDNHASDGYNPVHVDPGILGYILLILGPEHVQPIVVQVIYSLIYGNDKSTENNINK